MRTGHRNTKKKQANKNMRNIPKSKLMKKKHLKLQIYIQQIIRKLRKNTVQKYQKYPKPVLSQLFTKTNLHRYLTHTHTLTHYKVCRIFVGIYHKERQHCASQICLTDLSLFLDNLSTLRRALSPSLSLSLSGLTLLPFRSFSLNCAKKESISVSFPHTHTEKVRVISIC